MKRIDARRFRQIVFGVVFVLLGSAMVAHGIVDILHQTPEQRVLGLVVAGVALVGATVWTLYPRWRARRNAVGVWHMPTRRKWWRFK